MVVTPQLLKALLDILWQVDIPEGVATAQPILYLFVFTVLSIFGSNLVFIKWLSDKFLAALTSLNEQNQAQTALLISIKDTVDGISTDIGVKPTSTKRGFGD
jgi:hypothetical protein